MQVRSTSSFTSGPLQAFEMQVSGLWIKGTAPGEWNAIRVGRVHVTVAAMSRPARIHRRNAHRGLLPAS